MSVGMTPEMRALAVRAVACKAWRWMPGMTLTDGVATVVVTTGEYTWYEDRGVCHGMPCTEQMWEPAYGLVVKGVGATRTICLADGDWLPDLTDPATLGCLLSLVREAWGDARSIIKAGSRAGWGMQVDAYAEFTWLGPTEAHALVAALEAAP